jgi:hypothetical protein
MSEKNANYYQFRKELGYPVFVRFEDSELELKLEPMLTQIGFNKLDSKELSNISFHKNQTKVLKIQKANFRVSKQIDQSHALDTYGPENLTMLGSYDVYRYKNVGMMIFGGGNYFWELGLKNIETSSSEIRVIMARFLSWSLAPLGVVGFWGVPVDDGVVVMKPKEAKFESFFIDVKQMKLICVDGIKDIFPGFQLLRLDATLKDATRRMKKEALVSFLTMNTTYFSYQGLDLNLKTAIYDISSMVDGYVYPVENFQPRKVVQEA